MLGGGLLHFVTVTRDRLAQPDQSLRLVYRSELIHQVAGHPLTLQSYVADKSPLFYRRVEAISDRLREGYFLTAIRETLARLPTAASFQESHCGEIVAGIFAEEVLGLRKLYNKLSMLTAQNSNAYKMDLVMYDPNSSPLAFVFCEVKCSPKSTKDGLPAAHHKSCYADIFNSLREYSDDDKDFDLTAAHDNLSNIPDAERDRVKAALLPYSGSPVRYVGIAVIDRDTYDETECEVLHTRKSKKKFDVDIVCVERFPEMALDVHAQLARFTV